MGRKINQKVQFNKIYKNVLLERTLTGGAVIMVSSLIRLGIEMVYCKKKGAKLPRNPYSENTNASLTILWGAAIGAITGSVATIIRPCLRSEISKRLDN